MAELDNAKRTLNRATYTPIKSTKESPPADAGGGGRVVDKWSAIAGLHILPSEIKQLRRVLATHKPSLRILDIVERSFGADDKYAAAPKLNALAELASITPQDIAHVGEALIALRKKRHGDLTAATARIDAQLSSVLQSTPKTAPAVTLPKGFKKDTQFVNVHFPGATLYQHEETTPLKALTKKAKRRASTATLAVGAGSVTRQSFMLALPQESAAATTTELRLERLPLTLANLTDLAHTTPGLRDAVTLINSQAAELISAMDPRRLAPLDITNASLVAIQVATDVLYAFHARLEIEPVGFLHLERVGFTPAGIERGELAYSVPLSPAEEVNITHKEWSNTSEEFENIVTDFLEAYSEEGVAEKSELTQAASSQQQHSSGFNMSVTASGGYGPVSISASVGYNVADSSNTSQQFSRNQSSELTRKASARTKKEHKVSFKVASASGTEDQAVRLIKNPFTDRATRADYYQLIRKWRVDLYRYGVRLTYDVTIPEPGSDILSKILEIRSIQAALGQGFGAIDATLPWARFDLQPSALTRTSYMSLAALYGIAVEPPPAAELRIVRAFSRQWGSFDESKHAENNAFDIDVADDYFVQAVSPSLTVWTWEDQDSDNRIETDVAHWIGASGRFTINVFSWQLSSFTLEVVITAQLKTEVYQAWQMRAWGAMRDAAQARYESNRANLKARLTQLQEDLGSQDALSLRKIEREEVAKGVLRWLFGPSFTFVSPGLPEDLYGPSESVTNADIWSKVMAQGEIIKFLHHAIEWENMLYFLYPYFWSHTSRWEFKKYLDHPDFMHRTFLRAGSARVVLTIRPGFERDFVSFIDGGVLGAPATRRYLTIAEEMEAYAKTNYPGIQPANPIENARPLLTPLQRRTWEQMQQVIGWIESYMNDHGAYPTTAQGLAVLSTYGTVPAADPWGNAYVYRSPGRVNDYDLVSLGADGAEGGTGENADIVSWAEASLIGQWYEYTPTSALDIAFNEILPSA